MLGKLIICTYFIFISIETLKCWQYKILEDLPDLDSYGIDGPYLNEMYDLYGMFSKETEHYNKNGVRKFYHDGNSLTKVTQYPEHCRNAFHDSFKSASNYSMRVHEQSIIALKICNKLVKFDKLPLDERYRYLNRMYIPKAFCPYTQTYSCDPTAKYRTLDGSCNNLKQPMWGKTDTPMKRLLRPRYNDFLSEPCYKSVSGKKLPNPRSIAMKIHHPRDIDTKLNVLTGMYGQFLDHDITLTAPTHGPDGKPKPCTCGTRDKDCINIPTPPDDIIQKSYMGQKCQVTPRSGASFARFDCKMSTREQINRLTSWLDLSQIYGVTKEDNDKVRTMKNGLLRVSFLTGLRYEHLPLAEENSTACKNKDGKRCFFGPEIRMNQNLVLMSLHTLFLREHNRIARGLKKINPYWNDEKLFQETRRILIAIWQKISLKDWLPLIIGKEVMEAYGILPKLNAYEYFNEYDSYTNPQIMNEFATAAYRYGHTVVSGWVVKANPALKIFYNISLGDTLLQTSGAYTHGGVDGALRGALAQRASQADPWFTSVINDHLFENKDIKAETHIFSLSSLNINRGRDHGLQSYVHYRKLCGLSFPRSFDDVDYFAPEMKDRMKRVYHHVEDIDLYTGGLNEPHLKGAIVGPTFASIIAKQFRDLMYGDRFYFENGNDERTRFTPEQLEEIRKVTISRLICDNLDVDHIPKNPWFVPSHDNPLVSCESLAYVDLRYWKDNYSYEY